MSSRILVWDLPTRLFHWLMTVGFGLAAVIAFFAGEHSRLFPYHSLIGLTLALMVVLRIAWGVLGSRYARFRSFLYSPREVIEYFAGIFSGRGKSYIGHNPGSAYAIVAMLLLMLGIAGSGVALGAGFESAEELHEVLVYLMLSVVGVHVLGVILHTIRNRDNIVASMVHGWKAGNPVDGIFSQHFFATGLFLLATAAWTASLFSNYNSSAQSTTLPILGTVVHLGEAESEGTSLSAERGGHKDHDDD